MSIIKTVWTICGKALPPDVSDAFGTLTEDERDDIHADYLVDGDWDWTIARILQLAAEHERSKKGQPTMKTTTTHASQVAVDFEGLYAKVFTSGAGDIGIILARNREAGDEMEDNDDVLYLDPREASMLALLIQAVVEQQKA